MRDFRLSALVKRRGRTGWWAYLLWLVPFLFTAVMYAEEMSFHSGAGIQELWPLAVPVGIVMLQWYRPTILGWLLIAVPTALYFCMGVYYAIRNNIPPRHQWQSDPGGMVMGTIYLALLLTVCIVVLRSAWPRSSNEDNDA